MIYNVKKDQWTGKESLGGTNTDMIAMINQHI